MTKTKAVKLLGAIAILFAIAILEQVSVGMPINLLRAAFAAFALGCAAIAVAWAVIGSTGIRRIVRNF